MLNFTAVEKAAHELVLARKEGRLLKWLSAEAEPSSVADAHAIQDRSVTLLGDTVAGWKVAKSPTGEFIRGAILATRVFGNGAKIPSSLCPMKVAEVEIAFRFDRDLPPRETEYSYEEVADRVTPFAALEIVDSRFSSYADTHWAHRLADFMSNGAFVVGESVKDWRARDLSSLKVSLAVDGEVKVKKVGGHPTIDPLLPVVALANAFRTGDGVSVGAFVTTGSFTGMTAFGAATRVDGTFTQFGTVSAQFV